MNLTKQGKFLIGSVSASAVLLIVLFTWLCWPVAIVISLLYIAFMIFNYALNKYCNNLIDKNNKDTEEYARINNLKVKSISTKDYYRLMNKDGADIGDNIIINKNEVTLI